MSLSVDGTWLAGVWNTSVWASGVWSESTPVVTPFYRLNRRGKPRPAFAPQRDLERFAEAAFKKPAEEEIETPSVILDITFDESMPPTYDTFGQDIIIVSALLDQRLIRTEKQVIKKEYDDDEDLLSFL